MKRAISLIFLISISAAAAFTQTLTVTGDLTTPVTLKVDDLAAMPRASVSAKEHEGAAVTYQGVPLREILKRAAVPMGTSPHGKTLAVYVLAKGHDGYRVVFSLGEIDPMFGNAEMLVADKREGQPMAAPMGPLRLVCPNDKAGARSVRMLESLTLVSVPK